MKLRRCDDRKEYDRMRYYMNREERLQYTKEYQARPEVKERIKEWQRKRYNEIKQNGLWSIA